MAKTAAMRALDSAGVPYQVVQYPYVERGGTRASSQALGVDEHQVVKTLVFESDAKDYVIVLMHGDQSVSTKKLARAIGCKSTRPCEPRAAEQRSGYRVGGTSPFGLKNKMPIYMQESISILDEIYVNAGRRGSLFRLSPEVVEQQLAPLLGDFAA